MYLDRKFGLNLSLSEITLLFDLSLYLDRTLAQRKAQRKAKSKVKVAQCSAVIHSAYQHKISLSNHLQTPVIAWRTGLLDNRSTCQLTCSCTAGLQRELYILHFLNFDNIPIWHGLLHQTEGLGGAGMSSEIEMRKQGKGERNRK